MTHVKLPLGHLMTYIACILQPLTVASMQVKDMLQVPTACGDLLCLACCRESSGKHGQRYDNLVGQAKEQWKGQTASDLCECADACNAWGSCSRDPTAMVTSAVVHNHCTEPVAGQTEHSTQVSTAAFNTQFTDADPNAHGQAKATSEGTDEKKRKM